MSLLNNAVINIFSILLLIILCSHSLKNTDDKSIQLKLFIAMLLLTIAMLFFDIMGRFDGNPDSLYPYLNHTGNFFIFLLNSVLPTIWFLYVNYQIYHDEERTKKLLLPLLLLNLVNGVMVVVSQFSGWYYSIDSGNIYHRGPLFFISTLFTISLIWHP